VTGDMPHPSREIQLAARPEGEPTPDDFRLAETEVPDPGPGEVLVRNAWMSVDPYMRGRMDDRASYVAPFALDAPLDGHAVGEVLASGDDAVAVGAWVTHRFGWRELAVLPAAEARVVDVDAAPAERWLGVLGMPGLTAWAGLEIAALQEGDVVFVSGAAGAVGSMVAQIALLRGHRVIGSAGTPEKIAWLTGDLGLTAAFDYHDGPIAERLAEAAPDGIDVYFDNVGGEQLEAAIGAMNLRGRVAMCGSISGYNSGRSAPGPRNLGLIVGRRLRLQGFLVGDHEDLRPAFEQQVIAWLDEGRLQPRETVREGLEEAPQAMIDLLRGANTGKMLVRIS
jgi:NADPH-dependent curcumin reductase CurA